MNKNAIHNFNITIRNSTDIKSSQELTKVIIKELAKVSKEMSQQKDILQEWQEQKIQNATTTTNNLSTLPEGGATDTAAERIMRTATLVSNTPSDSGEAVASFKASNGTAAQASNIFNIKSVADTTGIVNTGFSQSDINNLSVFTAENDTLNFSKGVTTKYYVATQQTLMVPQTYKENTGEPYIDAVKAEIKRKLEVAIAVDNVLEIDYWRNISKAFEEEATAKDFDGKPSDILFTKMYALLKQSSIIETQNFNWEIVCKKMIESIGANILNGTISEKNKNRWETIRKQLGDDKINIANLFEKYNELFLLLKQVEGLDTLPNTITITTKTKIYPNLSADKLYADIGKNDVYIFLKEISNEDIQGSAVYRGAIKIRNTAATSFVVGESLEFFLDENFINQNLYQKENINWIVCNIKDKKDKGTIFVNEGTSFNYNFDKPGIYRIDAYGRKDTIAGKKIAKSSTFIELEIVAQQIIITPPSFIKNEVARAFSEEKFFKVSLKNDVLKTLNPLKLYYQLETVTANKVIKISDEQKLDATGIIKLAMPALGDYKIKVISKDQYALTQDCKISVIKNEVTSIGVAKESFNKKIFLLGDSNKTLALETKNFRINPATDEEKEDVKWIIYDSNNKVYLPSGSVLLTDDNNTKKTYLHKWNSFDVPIPQKVGYYTVEAYSDFQKVTKSQSVFKFEVKHPQVTEAYWASSGGSKKETSGFSGESNWIKTNIPYYSNQPVRIYFYLNNKKTNHYFDLKTNEEGIIFKEIKFDSEFKKLIGFLKGKNAKIGFKVLGIQNEKPYQFRVPANYESDTVLSVTTDAKILDVYFMYEGIRVNPFTSVPYGAKINGVIKTLNMVGNEVVLKVRRKNAQHSQLKMKTIVKSEGEASITFILDKKWRPITPLFDIIDSYYLGVEGVESKLYLENGMNAVVSTVISKKNEEVSKYGIDIPYFLKKYKGENETNLRVLLNEMNEYYTSEKITPLKEKVSYTLATVYIETFKTFKPVIESFWITDKKIREKTYYRYDPVLADSDKRRKTAIERGNTMEGDGVKYCGRGYVQLTWKNNYKKIKNQFGVDVINYPEKVLEPKLATKIMIWGMDNGIFTGVSINNYINSSTTDYVNARKVINGTDRDEIIANNAQNFEKSIRIIKSNKTYKSKSLSVALEEMKIIADKHLPYKQEGNTGKSEGLRTSLNDEALKKMDCSEFVCRYLHKLGITDEVKWVTTASMTSESSFQKALGTEKIKFMGKSKDFQPQAGDIFVWWNGDNGHTGIVYKYDNFNDLVTILEAIGKSGSRDNDTNKKNGGYNLANCTRTSVYKSKGEALFAHPGFIGYFRPKKI